MSLLPSAEKVRKLLIDTGALRKGHFILPDGVHTETHLQTSLALRYHRNARILSVALSRLLRRVPSVRPQLPKVTIVTSTSSGIPVAFGVRDALDADEIFWTQSHGRQLKLQEFVEIRPGEQFIIVDDVLREGYKPVELCRILSENDGEVLAIGVLVDLRIERSLLANHYVHALLHIPTQSYNPDDCPLCQAGQQEPVKINHF